MILAKETLSTEQDQIVVARDQLAECLPALETRLAQMGKLEALLEQTDQEKGPQSRNHSATCKAW